MASLLEQVQQLEGKIRAVTDVAQGLRVERDTLAKEVESLRKSLSEEQRKTAELLAARDRVDSLSQENQVLVTERDEVRRRVESMLSRLAELEEVAAT